MPDKIETERAWAVGDSAKRKDGGPIFTIVKVYEDKTVGVAWFERKKMHREIVPIKDIEPVMH